MTAKEVIEKFFETVRSGIQPDAAHNFMEKCVLAHQVTAENEETVERSPDNYADHVREMIATYGEFKLEIQELLAEDDRVYVRWKQTGNHLREINGISPTGKQLIEIASAVYRVTNGKIVEYWIQVDREGLRIQLER